MKRMGFIVTAGIISIFALGFMIIGHALNKEGRDFEQIKRVGKAKVVGYDGTEESNVYNLLVEILEINDGKLYTCEPSMSNLIDYPVGRIIDVCYATKKVMGINVIEVHLLDSPPVNSSKFGSVIKKCGIVLFIIAFILIIVGIILIL